MNVHGPGCAGLDHDPGRQGDIRHDSDLPGANSRFEIASQIEPRLNAPRLLPQPPEVRVVHTAIQQLDAVAIDRHQIVQLADHTPQLGSWIQRPLGFLGRGQQRLTQGLGETLLHLESYLTRHRRPQRQRFRHLDRPDFVRAIKTQPEQRVLALDITV